MHTTIEIKPTPPLQPYVRCFALREFDTLGTDIVKPMLAMHEFCMTFFIKGTTLLYLKNLKSKLIRPNKSLIIGLQTRNNGSVVFNGKYSIFCIKFNANGFYNIFGLPMNVFINQVHNCEEVFGKDIHLLHQQLQESQNIEQMASYAESLLLTFLVKSKISNPFNQINSASCLILHQIGKVNIEKLADDASMSLRRFEINFTEQVGLAPKLFARIIRFNQAINLKIMQPDKNWTAIACLCNYHDQMHLIKDFKTFSGETPSAFFAHIPPKKDDLINIINPSF